MRWSGQTLDDETTDDALPGLRLQNLVRSVRTPEFAGMTFHEVLAKSALNHVPGSSTAPFSWTINPYRGCSHACVYCFARNTHTYLDLDAGDDFDREIVVKINIVDVLRRELGKASWRHEPVALGTNTDPYQRAEGRYRLMPGIIEALAASGTPFSILTKGTAARRDLPLIAAAGQQVPVAMGVSIALCDQEVHRLLEPGAPSPHGRLKLVEEIAAAGLCCQVLVAPVLPMITDTDEQLDAVLGRIAAAGATGASVSTLHLRPGAREWFSAWLAREHPDLVDAYAELYRGGSYVLRSYTEDLGRRAAPLLRKYGLTGGDLLRAVGDAPASTRPRPPESPMLF